MTLREKNGNWRPKHRKEFTGIEGTEHECKLLQKKGEPNLKF